VEDSTESERIVLVTGGTRGIGAACAKKFHTAGDRVAVLARTSIALPEWADPDRYLAVTADVADHDQVEAAFAQIEQHWGPVEVLVANSGINRDKLVIRMTPQDWSAVIDTNLTGTFNTTRRAATKMLRLRRGRIIVVSSVSAFVGPPGQANYAASKAGQIGLARSLAHELASRSVTVNVVAPGFIDTDMLDALDPQYLKAAIAQVPLARVGDPDEVAATVQFLASPAAGYITGAVIPIDGGLAMGL
jgi:3-oxoacyl-[acyl-carrier protein] reductase